MLAGSPPAWADADAVTNKYVVIPAMRIVRSVLRSLMFEEVCATESYPACSNLCTKTTLSSP